MKKILTPVVIMGFLATLLFGGGSSKGSDIPALIKEGALVIDVRSAAEYAGGHIEGALNIPHTAIGNEITRHETDKDRAIVVYCLSGGRSAAAKKSLKGIGYAHVINGGGFTDMQKMMAADK